MIFYVVLYTYTNFRWLILLTSRTMFFCMLIFYCISSFFVYSTTILGEGIMLKNTFWNHTIWVQIHFCHLKCETLGKLPHWVLITLYARSIVAP